MPKIFIIYVFDYLISLINGRYIANKDKAGGDTISEI